MSTESRDRPPPLPPSYPNANVHTNWYKKPNMTTKRLLENWGRNRSTYEPTSCQPYIVCLFLCLFDILSPNQPTTQPTTQPTHQLHGAKCLRSRSAGQIPYPLLNTKVHYCVHKSTLLVPTLSQMHPVHNFSPYFFWSTFWYYCPIYV
jgi:hypothetical protein